MLKLSKYNSMHFRKGISSMARYDEFVQFGDALEDDDWGLIIGNDGELKGLWIPEGKEDDLVPESIITICEKYFGVDLTQDGNTSTTLH